MNRSFYRSKILPSVISILAVSGLATFAAFTVLPESANPENFKLDGETLEYSFDKLPLEGNLKDGGGVAPWSDTFWPANQGGITYSFMETNAEAREKLRFHPLMPSLNDLKGMTPDALKKLAPSVKFDIANRDYEYTLTKRVLKQYSPIADKFNAYRSQLDAARAAGQDVSSIQDPTRDSSWWGICHGWTPAAINFAEPKAKPDYVNADGVAVPFGSSDVKALLSYMYAWDYAQFNDAGIDQASNPRARPRGIVPFEYRRIGMRCPSRDDLDVSNRQFRRQQREDCKGGDVNAGTLHLLLTNYLGIMKKGFVADVTPDAANVAQVWNQPVLGFKSRVVDTKGRGLFGPKGVSKRVRIKTTITYIYELVPTYDPHLAKQYERNFDLDYWVYLDSSGRVIGGKFESGVIPDQIWRASPIEFQGPWEILKDIYVPVEKA